MFPCQHAVFFTCRITAPSFYIFFASVIPALAFGEQIEEETHGKFNGVHVLLATAIAGVVQAVVGGQPLLIIGVAEPIVLVFGFMYKFAENQGFEDHYVAWCAWTNIWTAIFLIILSVSGPLSWPRAPPEQSPLALKALLCFAKS